MDRFVNFYFLYFLKFFNSEDSAECIQNESLTSPKIEHYFSFPQVLNLTGKSKDSLLLHMLLPGYSVVVLSPTILVNHLCGKTPRLSEGIASFTLLVFDECHHTQKDDSYNDIMHYYLKEKRKGFSTSGTVLPQASAFFFKVI